MKTFETVIYFLLALSSMQDLVKSFIWSQTFIPSVGLVSLKSTEQSAKNTKVIIYDVSMPLQYLFYRMTDLLQF